MLLRSIMQFAPCYNMSVCDRMASRKPVDADLPDTDDEQEDDDPVLAGTPWDDPNFAVPSSIQTRRDRPFTGVEWIRPPVSTITNSL